MENIYLMVNGYSNNMLQEEIKNYIDDNVRKSTDSSIQALTNIVKSHHNAEIAAHEEFRNKLLAEVVDVVKTTVNGKIDLLNKKQDEQSEKQNKDSEKIDILIERTTPVVKEYEEKQVIRSVANRFGIGTSKFAAFIGSVTVIGAAIIWITNKLMK